MRSLLVLAAAATVLLSAPAFATSSALSGAGQSRPITVDRALPGGGSVTGTGTASRDANGFLNRAWTGTVTTREGQTGTHTVNFQQTGANTFSRSAVTTLANGATRDVATTGTRNDNGTVTLNRVITVTRPGGEPVTRNVTVTRPVPALPRDASETAASRVNAPWTMPRR